ncbi:MAG: hypothetical protein Q7P63_08585 [Verrucomicrobiota bacterium JB022]|nr:hypothetical protein [Verrucomicrobiota bacterium JB022]
MSRFFSLFVGLVLIVFAIWFYTRPDEEAATAPAPATTTPRPAQAPEASSQWAELDALAAEQPSLASARAAELLQDTPAGLSPTERDELQGKLAAWLPSAIGEQLATGRRDNAERMWATLVALTPAGSPHRAEARELWQADLLQHWQSGEVEEPEELWSEADRLGLFATSAALVEAYQQWALQRFAAAERQDAPESARWLTEAATARTENPGPLGEVLKGEAWSVRALEAVGNKLVASGQTALAPPFYEAALAKARTASPVWGYTDTLDPDAIIARLSHNLARALLTTGRALSANPQMLRTTLPARQCFLKARALQPADLALRTEIEAALASPKAPGA